MVAILLKVHALRLQSEANELPSSYRVKLEWIRFDSKLLLLQTKMPDWVSHISPDGRPYWFNPADNVSVWEKPDELKTSQEKELGLLNWKEYQTAGRKYWVNSITKETTWECPKEVLAILNKPNPS